MKPSRSTEPVEHIIAPEDCPTMCVFCGARTVLLVVKSDHTDEECCSCSQRYCVYPE